MQKQKVDSRLLILQQYSAMKHFTTLPTVDCRPAIGSENPALPPSGLFCQHFFSRRKVLPYGAVLNSTACRGCTIVRGQGGIKAYSELTDAISAIQLYLTIQCDPIFMQDLIASRFGSLGCDPSKEAYCR